MNAHTTASAAVVSFVMLMLAGLIFAVAAPQRPAPKCSPEYLASLAGGLQYAQGYRAGLTVTGAASRMADANVVATQAAIDACH